MCNRGNENKRKVKVGDIIVLSRPFAQRYRLKGETFAVKEITWTKEGHVFVADPRIDGNILACEYDIVTEEVTADASES